MLVEWQGGNPTFLRSLKDRKCTKSNLLNETYIHINNSEIIQHNSYNKQPKEHTSIHIDHLGFEPTTLERHALLKLFQLLRYLQKHII